MIAGPEHSRVAQVRSDGGNGLVTGSGYLVAPGLVVTASQVVRGAEKIKILLAQSDGNHANSDPMDARILSGMVAMIDDQVGVAVIALRPDAVAWPEMPPARLSNVPAADLGGASDVVAVGLLDQASLGGSRDFVRITGKVLHQEDRSSGTLTFEIDQKMLDTDGAPWTGMAGAPLWIDDQIIGVILAASRDRRALIAASSERVLANRDFVRLLESAGMREGGGLAEQGGELAEAESAAHRDAANADSIGFRELGRMAEQRGDLAGAERAYRQAADMGNSAAFRDLGHLSEQRGDLTNAERAYRQAADMGNSAAFRDLGHLSEQRGDLTNAER
ncbi:trypsin-like peptidase domain-containing protein, partial [Kribbella sp. NPDC049227]|uniref:trypsin-like peptidase domain-containing protein n=1 Tax=Kribbella sp. NPDC049227 TaxID=3364113 RepID=UPI0037103D44